MDQPVTQGFVLQILLGIALGQVAFIVCLYVGSWISIKLHDRRMAREQRAREARYARLMADVANRRDAQQSGESG